MASKALATELVCSRSVEMTALSWQSTGEGVERLREAATSGCICCVRPEHLPTYPPGCTEAMKGVPEGLVEPLTHPGSVLQSLSG